MKRMACGEGKNARYPFPIDDGAALEIASRYLKLPPLLNDETAQGTIVFPPGGVS